MGQSFVCKVLMLSRISMSQYKSTFTPRLWNLDSFIFCALCSHVLCGCNEVDYISTCENFS